MPYLIEIMPYTETNQNGRFFLLKGQYKINHLFKQDFKQALGILV